MTYFRPASVGVARVLPFVALVAVIAAACGSSNKEIGRYFSAANSTFERHSRTVTAAEDRMFELTGASPGGGLAFGRDTGLAVDLLPVFSAAAADISSQIGEWDALAPPDEALHYHELVQEAMELRRMAMEHGAATLAAIIAGEPAPGAFAEPERLMARANDRISLALAERERLGG